MRTPISTLWIAVFVCCAMVHGADPSQGFADAVRDVTEVEVEAARAKLAHEPSVDEVVREALRYFRVHPEVIERLRSAARKRGMFPLLATGYRFDDDAYVRFESQELTQPRINNENTRTHKHAVTVGMVWDLRELTFNPAEVQVYGLIGVQRNLMLEVARVFYLRRQLLLRFSLRPPGDAVARAALQLRVDEFTAMLDILTDGWFSRTSRLRARSRRFQRGNENPRQDARSRRPRSSNSQVRPTTATEQGAGSPGSSRLDKATRIALNQRQGYTRRGEASGARYSKRGQRPLDEDTRRRVGRARKRVAEIRKEAAEKSRRR